MMERAHAHAKVDEVFDALEALAKDRDPYILHKLMLQGQPGTDDNTVEGVVLVERTGWPAAPYVTWGISPYHAGLHSGHYDMLDTEAVEDWFKRVGRGW
jgi:hypothetical protein